MEDAQKSDILFEIGGICNMQNIYMDDLHFIRIISVLLDNAVEESEKTENPHVSLAVQKKKDQSLLFILSNNTSCEPDFEQIVLPGFTTKVGHMGQGLAQVRAIISEYGNATLNFSFYKNNFTVYLEIKPSKI